MDVDVIVAGAGPCGLMLAGELALRGVRTVVVEREPRPAPGARANGLVGQTVRVMDQRGLYAALSRAGRATLPWPARLGMLGQRSRPVPAARYQYGGFDLHLRDLPDNPLYVLPVPQRRLEAVVERWAVGLGAQVRRGHELTGFDMDDVGVTAHVAGPAGTYRVRAAFLVGCDGAHSGVRKAAGIGFPGVTRTDLISRNAQVRLPRSLLSVTGALRVPAGTSLAPYQFHRTAGGAFSFAPFPGGLHTVNTYEWAAGPADDVPMTLSEMRASLRRVLGGDLAVAAPDGLSAPVLRRVSARNTRMVDRYREGRVLVAGDAAHVFTGFGGPGLNLGLGDVVNLGWKLAAAVAGTAPPGLLDTYATERGPQAAQVLEQTLVQADLLAPGPAVDERRRQFAAAIATPAGLRRVVEVIAGAALAYPVPGGADAGPLVGRLAPDLPLGVVSGPPSGGVRRARDVPAGGGRLAHRQRAGRPLLVHTEGPADHLRRAVRGRVDLVAAPAAAGRPDAVLVRPDGYVAWAGHLDDPGLTQALDAWFGPAA